MENIKRYKIFEALNKMSDDERDLFDRISNNNETWIKSLKKYLDEKNLSKLERFMKHFKVVELIKSVPNEMASYLLPLIEDANFRGWLKSVESELPDEFRESFGLASDMKNLGF